MEDWTLLVWCPAIWVLTVLALLCIWRPPSKLSSSWYSNALTAPVNSGSDELNEQILAFFLASKQFLLPPYCLLHGIRNMSAWCAYNFIGPRVNFPFSILLERLSHRLQRVFDGSFLGRPAIIKQRFSKKYRHAALDSKLTQLGFKQVLTNHSYLQYDQIQMIKSKLFIQVIKSK